MNIPKKVTNLIGTIFNRLTVVEFIGINKNRASLWKCKCIDGNEVIVSRSNLQNGHTQSCGCLRKTKPKNPICKRGHNKDIVGRTKQGNCMECLLEYNRQFCCDISSGKKTLKAKPQLCIKGHDTFICGRNKYGRCKDCINENKKIYYIEHKDEIDAKHRIWVETHKDIIQKWVEEHKEERDAYHQQYRIEHADRVLLSRCTYYDKNRDAIIAYAKQYNKDHPEVHRLNKLKSHAKRKLRIVSWGQQGIFDFYSNCPDSVAVDHIIPLCGKLVSGLHVSWNLQYLTKSENSKKHNKCNLLEASEWYGKILEEAGLK
jgi:hypothetical protein